MKRIIYTTIALLALSLCGSAQQTFPYKGYTQVHFPEYVRDGDRVTFTADIDFSLLELQTNQLVELTPLLRSTQTAEEIQCDPVVISGKQRARIRKRNEHFEGYRPKAGAAPVIILKKNTQRSARVEISVPLEKWMRHSELIITETVIGCRDIQQEYDNGATSYVYRKGYTFPEPHQPVFAVSYIVPEVEPVKTMSDTYSAQLTFQVNRSNLLPEFGNNAAVLTEADRLIGNITNDTLFTVNSIRVAGYASPEGNEASNMKLSTDRAQAFVDYLNRRDPRLVSLVTSRGMGEDWEGLVKAVEKAPLSDRDLVLFTIRDHSNAASRKNALKNLSGGSTWRTLLNDYFPPLRRNEYTIEYEVRGFNAEEARQYVWTRPQLLSLNEFFMVAGLYEPTSKEYKEVFDIAARVYPESPVAQFNTAAMEVESGAYDSAIQRLERMDTPESWNNLAIALWHKGEYEKAEEFFGKAAETGFEEARRNREQYQLWLKDKD